MNKGRENLTLINKKRKDIIPLKQLEKKKTRKKEKKNTKQRKRGLYTNKATKKTKKEIRKQRLNKWRKNLTPIKQLKKQEIKKKNRD